MPQGMMNEAEWARAVANFRGAISALSALGASASAGTKAYREWARASRRPSRGFRRHIRRVKAGKV